jgi:hypothetical protein
VGEITVNHATRLDAYALESNSVKLDAVVLPKIVFWPSDLLYLYCLNLLKKMPTPILSPHGQDVEQCFIFQMLCWKAFEMVHGHQEVLDLFYSEGTQVSTTSIICSSSQILGQILGLDPKCP